MSGLPAGMDEEQFVVDEDAVDNIVNVSLGTRYGVDLGLQNFPYFENVIDFVVNVAMATSN